MEVSPQKRNRHRSANRPSHWRTSLKAVMQPATNEQGTTEVNVGRRLQELRVSQGYSIRSLAEISGLNFNTLSLIENEKTSPNVNTLQQLATALQVPITAFFETTHIPKEVVYQKKQNRPMTHFPHGQLEDLGDGLALGEATPLLLTANAGTSSGPGTIVHSGQEFIYCLDGSLEYTVGREQYLLEAGDSLIFQAYIPHRWENKGQATAHCILIVCPSDTSDRSVGQHLGDKVEAISSGRSAQP